MRNCLFFLKWIIIVERCQHTAIYICNRWSTERNCLIFNRLEKPNRFPLGTKWNTPLLERPSSRQRLEAQKYSLLDERSSNTIHHWFIFIIIFIILFSSYFSSYSSSYFFHHNFFIILFSSYFFIINLFDNLLIHPTHLNILLYIYKI